MVSALPSALVSASAIGWSLSVNSEIWSVAEDTEREIDEKSVSAVWKAPEACSTLSRIAATRAWFSLPTICWKSRTSLINSWSRSGASSVSDCTTDRCPGMTGTPAVCLAEQRLATCRPK